MISFDGKANASDNQDVTITYSPSNITVGADDIGSNFTITVMANDTDGNSRSCRFMVIIQGTILVLQFPE